MSEPSVSQGALQQQRTCTSRPLAGVQSRGPANPAASPAGSRRSAAAQAGRCGCSDCRPSAAPVACGQLGFETLMTCGL
jgi:hypothetical protein